MFHPSIWSQRQSERAVDMKLKSPKSATPTLQSGHLSQLSQLSKSNGRLLYHSYNLISTLKILTIINLVAQMTPQSKYYEFHTLLTVHVVAHMTYTTYTTRYDISRSYRSLPILTISLSKCVLKPIKTSKDCYRIAQIPTR